MVQTRYWRLLTDYLPCYYLIIENASGLGRLSANCYFYFTIIFTAILLFPVYLMTFSSIGLLWVTESRKNCPRVLKAAGTTSAFMFFSIWISNLRSGICLHFLSHKIYAVVDKIWGPGICLHFLSHRFYAVVDKIQNCLFIPALDQQRSSCSDNTCSYLEESTLFSLHLFQ